MSDDIREHPVLMVGAIGISIVVTALVWWFTLIPVETSIAPAEVGALPASASTSCTAQVLKLESLPPTYTVAASEVKIHHRVRVTNLGHATHQFLICCGIDYADKPTFDALAIGVSTLTVGPTLTKPLTLTINSATNGTFFQPHLEVTPKPGGVEYVMVCNGGEWQDGQKSEYADVNAQPIKFTLPVLLYKKYTDIQALRKWNSDK